MTPKDRLEELDLLLLDWEDNALDDPGVERLREILRADEEARAQFVRLQMMNAALKFDDEAGLLSFRDDSGVAKVVKTFGQQPSSEGFNQPRERRPQKWILAIAALAICALAGRVIQLELAGRRYPSVDGTTETSGRPDTEEATAQGVALVTRLVDAEWGRNQKPLEVGDALLPGQLSLASGYAQVEFFCGATVIIEGPAELDLQSPLLARVQSGRLRAQVPPAARGFSLEIDDIKVVDLGTEFGLSVTQEGASVQVFDGEVELQQPALENRLLTAGQALIRRADGEYSESEIAPETFLDIATLESRAAGQHDARFERWRVWSEQLRHDERLIVYYAFDQQGGWQRRLNSSVLPENHELDGAIVGAHRVPGRWKSKSGLEFKRPGDRVRVQIPGEFNALTLACWVRIDSLDRWYNSLFLTDNYNKGEPHWQVLDSGQLYFSVRPSRRDELGPRDFKALSPPFWNAALSGRWIHLAVVYDVDERTICHFLNGSLLSQHDIPPEQIVPTQIGAASIGNWSLPTRPDSEFAIRNLNGSMDEFVIFAAALSADEITEIYDYGKP